MKNNELHIVSFDVPFPANYGGVIDVFYRIKALHSMGVKIHLHCFEYGRGQSSELEKYCESVHFYTRKKRILDLFSSLPFIVKSRINKDLLADLKSDNLPILFEGLHTIWYLNDVEISNRNTFVRTHNIEHSYYSSLGKKSSFLKKIYFYIEANKLKKFENLIGKAKNILAIKQSDFEYFKRYSKNTFLLHPSFEKNDFVEKNITEKYCLFHGNLSVKENEDAVLWLVKNVWNDSLGIQLKIAGKNPSEKIKKYLKEIGVELIINPSESEMQYLIQNAHIHLLYTDQSTGIKLKLIHSIQTTGHILANDQMLLGTGLDKFCNNVNSGEEYKKVVNQLKEIELSESQIQDRKHFFENDFDMIKTNQIILELIN